MNTFMRRTIAAVADDGSPSFLAALAQDWKEQFPELTIGISSGENETDAIARTQRYADYLSRTLGVPVKIVRGTDYAAVIEAMRAEQSSSPRSARPTMRWPAR